MDTVNLYQPPRFLLGLDLGQTTDPTALLIAERQMLLGPVGRLEPRFLIRFLERVELGTSYPVIVRGVRKRLATLGEPCALVVDATGVGRGVVDMFREPATAEQQREELAFHPHSRWCLPRRLTPIAIRLTGGEHVTSERWDMWNVPKRDVVMALQVCLQQERFQVARALPEAQTLVNEAKNFQWKISRAGHDQYGAWREGQHDDLLLAAAILVWWGEKYAVTMPQEQRQTHATGPGNPLAGATSHRHAMASGGRRNEGA